MRREAKLLLKKSIDSLLLGIEHFNRPFDRGRSDAVLIFLDHSFEMLLKAVIAHKGGRIREGRAKETIGFDHCVRKCLSNEGLKSLTEDQARTLRTINGFRDAATHYMISLPEDLLYLHTQAAVSTFRDVLRDVFGRNLGDVLPTRAMPVSTTVARDMPVIVADEFSYIRSLLAAGRRRRTEARARLRWMAIMENAVAGASLQPGESDLERRLQMMARGTEWYNMFPNVAGLKVQAEGSGPTLSIRISKSDGLPVRLVKEGEPEAALVAVKRVDELGYYSLGFKDILRHLKQDHPSIGQNQLHALINHLRIRGDPDCFKEFTIGSSKFKRYSRCALEKLRAEIPQLDLARVTAEYAERKR